MSLLLCIPIALPMPPCVRTHHNPSRLPINFAGMSSPSYDTHTFCPDFNALAITGLSTQIVYPALAGDIFDTALKRAFIGH